MTTTDHRALAIITFALLATAYTAQAYATARAPFAALALATLCTLALVLAWARVKHKREQRRPAPVRAHRVMTDSDIEAIAHEQIDATEGYVFGFPEARPTFGDVAASGMRAANGLAVARVRYPIGMCILAVSPDGSAFTYPMPEPLVLVDVAAVVAHIAVCPDRVIPPASRQAAAAVMEFLQHCAKHTRRIA